MSFYLFIIVIIIIMKKLQRYAQFINKPFQERLRLVKQAKTIKINHQNAYNIVPKKFEEENFISLNVFDTIKTQTMHKLQTYRQNSKNENPKAVVAMFHGLGSHTNMSGHVAHYLSERNITTVGFDFRGFGKSQGNRAYIQNLDIHMKDTQKFVNMVRELYPKTPLFAAGLSLGGLTAYQLTLRHPEWFKGAVMLAPAVMPSMQISHKMNFLINLFQFLQIILPSDFKLRKPNLDVLCRYPQAVQIIKNDEFNIKIRFPLRTTLTMLKALRDSPQTFNKYVCPFLVIMGGKDRLIDPQVAFDLYKKTSTQQKDKDILFYEEMWHAIYYEPEIDQTKVKIADWILERV